MKKNIKNMAALGLSFAMAASLAACGGSSSTTETTAAGGDAAAEGSEAAGAADSEIPATELEVSGDNVSLSLFAGSIPENMPTGGALQFMADYLNANSNGTIEATAFFDTALGDATSMVQGLQQGTVDIGVSGTSYFTGLVPEITVFELPFLFSSVDEARVAIEGPAKDAIFEKLSGVGLVGLSIWENGFRELTNNVRPVTTPDDMQGIKMRVLPNEIQVATWEAMGALPATIDAGELYTALQQGTVDAQDNPLHEIVARRFYEVQPYITMTDAVYTPFLMAMSQMSWDKLSESQQALVMEAAALAKEKELELTDAAQANALQEVLDYGCEVVEDPDKEAFREKALPTWSLFTDQYGTELLDMVQASIDEANAGAADTEEATEAAAEDAEAADEEATEAAAEDAEAVEEEATEAAAEDAEAVEEEAADAAAEETEAAEEEAAEAEETEAAEEEATEAAE